MENNNFIINESKSKVAVFMNSVYSWMTGALLVSGFVAWWASSTPAILNLLYLTDGYGQVVGINKLVFYGSIAAEFGLVWWLSARIHQMNSEKAGLLFMIYSILNGLTLSFVFLIYTASSISTTFFITAGTFGAMSAFGYFTKRDLSAMGRILYMALIGLIIASVVNFFLRSEAFYWISSYVGVILFTGLTAYDTQKLKQMAEHFNDEESAKKGAIIGALHLYLDFVNLFLYLLRLFGSRD